MFKEDISNSVCFLVSPMASYITGITVYADGAAHLHRNKKALTKTLKSFI